jgi:hypothetical protein
MTGGGECELVRSPLNGRFQRAALAGFLLEHHALSFVGLVQLPSTELR